MTLISAIFLFQFVTFTAAMGMQMRGGDSYWFQAICSTLNLVGFCSTYGAP